MENLEKKLNNNPASPGSNHRFPFGVWFVLWVGFFILKLNPNRRPKIAKSLTAKGEGEYNWTLGKMAFGKDEEARGHNGTKMGKK